MINFTFGETFLFEFKGLQSRIISMQKEDEQAEGRFLSINCLRFMLKPSEEVHEVRTISSCTSRLPLPTLFPF
jgi:hypothetical protein